MARRRRNKRKDATRVPHETHAARGRRTVKVKPRKEKPCITKNPKPVA